MLGGAFLLKGFTNRDLRACLDGPDPPDRTGLRRRSGQVTRQLRLLRALGLIRKVTGTRYYRVTDQGQQTMTAALTLREADVAKLVA